MFCYIVCLIVLLVVDVLLLVVGCLLFGVGLWLLVECRLCLFCLVWFLRCWLLVPVLGLCLLCVACGLFLVFVCCVGVVMCDCLFVVCVFVSLVVL